MSIREDSQIRKRKRRSAPADEAAGPDQSEKTKVRKLKKVFKADVPEANIAEREAVRDQCDLDPQESRRGNEDAPPDQQMAVSTSAGPSTATKLVAKDRAAKRQAKSERRSKKKRQAGEEDDSSNLIAGTSTMRNTIAPMEEEDTEGESSTKPAGSQATYPSARKPRKPDAKHRFIVFIGNLPYSATTEAIQNHFSSLQPFSVRHSLDKATGQSRGFAFLEFEGYDKMQTCLKQYHHSSFGLTDAGAGAQTPSTSVKSSSADAKKKRARLINVELSAGGGGNKSETRKERIREKNAKLDEQRERARVQKEKEKVEGMAKPKTTGKEKEKGKGKGKGKGRRETRAQTGANTVQVGDPNTHPSRRQKMER